MLNFCYHDAGSGVNRLIEEKVKGRSYKNSGSSKEKWFPTGKLDYGQQDNRI
jgi:hypothetical protein